MHLVKTCDIPDTVTMLDGSKHGGLAVLGWSQGSVITLSMLAHAESLSTEVTGILKRYLRTVFVHGIIIISRTYDMAC